VRRTLDWSTLPSKQCLKRHVQAFDQLESHSKECVESQGRSYVMCRSIQQAKQQSNSCQSTILLSPGKSHSHSIKRTRLLLQSNTIQYNPIQSNPIQSNPSIIRQLFPHYQYQRTLKGKFDLCQVWNLGPLSQVLPLTAIHIPSNHSGHQCHQQHYQEQQQDPQESKIFCKTRALAVFDRDRLVGRYRRYHSIVDKHRAVRRRMVSLRASFQCDDTFEVTDAISLR